MITTAQERGILTLSLAFSPNGELLATATTDNEICLWQVADGRKVLVCQGHTGWVHTVAFSPCGTLLASGSEDETIRLWDIQTGQCVATLEGHTNWVWSVAFSADGSTLASGSNDQTIRLWDVETGVCLNILESIDLLWPGKPPRITRLGRDRRQVFHQKGR